MAIIRTISTTIAAIPHQSLRTSRQRADRGSHAVEYALGIGLGAATILALFGAYKSGVAALIESWIFK